MRVVSARFVASAAGADQLPAATLPEIAFAGRSNVGKSSLLNRLMGRRALARVSKTPGRTRQLNFFAVNEECMLVDLPGYGFARVPRALQAQWRTLVEHYIGSRQTLRGTVVIVDARRGVEADDALVLDFLQARAMPAVVVATKIDKVARSRRRACLDAVAAARPDGSVIAFSAVTGEGVRALWGVIRSLTARPARAAGG